MLPLTEVQEPEKAESTSSRLFIDMSFVGGLEGTLFACFLGGASGKESTCNIGDMNSNPGSGRSPKERNSNLLQYSCLENSMDKGTWWAKVHGVTKNQTFWACTQFYHVACGILVP